MTHEEKLALLKTKGLCYRCCGNHLSRDCRTERLECLICKRRHITVLCKDMKLRKDQNTPYQKRRKLETTETDVKTTATSSNIECSGDVALQTLLMQIVNGGKQEVIRAFIDSGSQRSYLLKSTARRLGLKPVGSERVIHSLFGERFTPSVTHNKYNILVKSMDCSYENIFEIRDNGKICGSIPRVTGKLPRLQEELAEFGVTLADEPGYRTEIEMLIGADLYACILTGNVVRLSCGAVAIETKLGWTLLGNTRGSANGDSLANLSLTMSVADACITKLWELETLGIYDSVVEKPIKDRENLIKETFNNNITKLKDGRYSVKLPWKEIPTSLPQNWDVAFKRLHSTTKQLVDKSLFESYNQIFQEWERENFMERVNAESDREELVKHYVPHRAALKVDSLTTPVRPVFDASCRVGKKPSLNDLLHKGENLIQLIPDLILKFREKRVGFVADIRKAFLMISVDEEDRDKMRFLWWKNQEMKEVIEYRHARVMFGATCSPFILGAVLEHHLTGLKESDREFGQKLLSTFYVDNSVSSEDTFEEYINFREKSIDVLKEAGMDLRMWMSNLDGFEDKNTNVISVLGIQWDRQRDELFVNTKGITIPNKVTKRVILSTVQKIFDPLGFVCPAVLPMKILLQEIWLLKLKWDDELPVEHAESFLKWCEEATELKNIKIPRLVTAGITEKNNWSIHTFVDSSRAAYSTVIFLRVHMEGFVQVQLLAAKSRVAPVKRLTIPKLELMGCVIGARLTATIKKSLEIVQVKQFYWCDSTTALSWIRRETEWQTFVANRTREIRKLSEPSQWRHVPGDRNPADLPSRGCFPSRLVKSKWWEGPEWLLGEEDTWPQVVEMFDEDEVLAERRITKTVKKIMTLSILDTVKKQYSFEGYIRIMGWVRRFLYNKLLGSTMGMLKGDLSREELTRAEYIFIRQIQLEAFPMETRDQLHNLELMVDNWGLLRVKTRLTYRDDPPNFKTPILLPNQRPEVKQLIIDMHRAYCHAGANFLCTKLRNKYWILKMRRTVKAVISKCYRCRRFSAKQCIPESAPLPLDRIKDAEVFEVVGIDLGGPLILKNSKKVWLVIFTCAVYRAVHFELVGSLSSKAFIGVLEKFIKKYRRPNIIYTDNGTNFRGADNLFRAIDWEEVEGDMKRIEWKFNPVMSAWWGGWWERLLRTAKDMLKRTVGRATLNWKELEKIMATIAEAMNHRPLTYMSEDPADLEPLTPAVFLHPFGGVQFPEGELTEAQRLRFRFNYVKTLKKEVKDRFLKEYLAMMVSRNSKKPTRLLMVGELVLVGNDNRKRIEWPLGKVIQLIPGKDGVCRLAKVKTEGGELIRTVQRLFPLELDGQDDLSKQVKEKGYTTKSGRVVKVPVRFGGK